MKKQKKAAPRRKADALAVRPQAEDTSIIGVMGRMALDPRMTPDKLEKLIGLQLTVNKVNAEAAFDAAFRAMQPRIPRITKRGVILNKEKKAQSRFARYDDIRRFVDPILREFGFTLSFETDYPDGQMETVGILTHEAGHSKRSRFRSKPDESGGKNAIQGIGSARSYGQRYAVKDLLAIIEEGEDDDGQSAGRKPQPKPESPPLPIEHAEMDERVTLQQRDKLVKLIQRVGRTETEVRNWLGQKYGYESTREITRRNYDAIERAIEAPGALA